MRALTASALLLASASVFAGNEEPVYANCNKPSGHEVIDLACNIYFEARNEPLMGQYMVGHTVLNRMASKLYPNTVSEVVYEKRRSKATGKLVAMYSWTWDGKPDLVRNVGAWSSALRIAAELVTDPNRHPDMTFGALWYHADYVNPKWAKDYHRTTTVGRHIFYADHPETAYAVMNHIAGRAMVVLNPMKDFVTNKKDRYLLVYN